MYDDKIIHTLTDKINELLERYNELKETNESLRNELVSVKAQNEAQKNEIARLEDELKTKNVESEDIAKKIESELEYPGQIKVNVIRETKAVEYAK